ncbi:hypothetical protein D3C73_1501300 [compost metagenome]
MLKLGAALGDLCQHAVELLEVTAAGIVELDQFTAFGQRETDALATQYQLQADLVACRIDALQATALRAEQALFLIETDGAGGDVQLAGQVGDTVGLAAHGLAREKGMS